MGGERHEARSADGTMDPSSVGMAEIESKVTG